MYSYGYRYPRVPRKVEILYDDPQYRRQWARSAVMNRGIAAKSPWIAFLRQSGTLDEIADKLRKAVEQNRALYGVKPNYKTAAERRRTKIEKLLQLFKILRSMLV
jgi:hypothetical protein